MKPSEALLYKRDEVISIVLAHHARNPRVFGSVFRGEDDEMSDLDLLVDADAEMSLFDLSRIRVKLRDLLGVEVEILPTESIPEYRIDDFMAESRPL